MKYFTISEFIKSVTAIEQRVWNGANREAEDNIIALVAAVLDPLREKYGKPIKVTSGFRCKKINKNVGGEMTSQHMLGEAADIVGYNSKTEKFGDPKENYILGRMIVALGNFDQVIFEDVGKDNLLPGWIHVSWRRKGTNRGLIYKKRAGTKTYIKINPKELGL